MKNRRLVLLTGCLFFALAIGVLGINPVRAKSGGQPALETPAPAGTPTTTCGVGMDEPCQEENTPVKPDFMTSGPGFKLAAQPAPVSTARKTSLYIFWGEGCPHCAQAIPVLEKWAQEKNGLEVIKYEVYYDETNLEYFYKFADAVGIKPTAVPTIFMGDQYWIGWSEAIESQINSAVEACLLTGCRDAGAGIIPGRADDTTAQPSNFPPGASVPPGQVVDDNRVTSAPETTQDDILTVPILGKIDLDKQSLFVSTLLISFVDGVNPCSVWVLTMLLAITLHTGSRKKVFVIGLVFLTVTAAVYALFIAGLFSVFSLTGELLSWIQVVVALVALFFALVNIKDYFWYQEGLSFTIDKSKKPGLYKQMRRLTDASQSMWGLISGTIVLSGGVSLVEFSCTAGFPVLWTNLLLSQKVAVGTFLALLLVYMLVYQLDEMAIFLAAVFSLKASRLEEKHGRILKLIGGTLMLTLAIVMLFKPELMNKLSSSLIIFGIAFGVTLLIFLLHQVILPRFGIRIGTLPGERRRRKHSHGHKQD